MKRSILLVCCLLGLCQPIFSQNSKVDSLLKVFRENADPKVQYQALYKLMFHFMSTDPIAGKKYCYQLIGLGQKLSDRDHLEALIWMCDMMGSLGQVDSVEILAQIVLREAPKKGLPVLEGRALNQLGILADQRGDFKIAIESYQLALPKFQRIKDSLSTLINLGVVYIRNEQLEKAIHTLNHALRLSKSIKDEPTEGSILTNLAEVYMKIGKIDDAIRNTKLALEVHEKLDYKSLIAYNYGTLGLIYKDKKEFEESFSFYKKALVYAEASQDTFEWVRTLAGFELALIENKQLEAASVYIKQGLALAGNEPQFQITRSDFLRDLASIENARSNFDKAIRFAKEALAIMPSESTAPLPYIYDELVVASKGLGNYRAAFEYKEIATAIRDSLKLTERTKAIAEIDAKYQTAEKDKSIALLENEKLTQAAEISRHRSQVLYLSLAAIALLLGGGLLFFRNRYRQTLEMEKMRSRISADLHDEVGSSLSHLNLLVGSFDLENSPAETARNVEKSKDIMQKTASDIRDVVWAIDARRDKISDLLDRMEDFAFDLLATRQIQTHFSSDGLDREAVLNPFIRQNIYLIFKEAINNIAKHSTATEVKISLKKDLKQKNAALEMEILDNGKTAKAAKVKGLGMESMQVRAKRIGGDLVVEQTEDGFSVRLTAPLVK